MLFLCPFQEIIPSRQELYHFVDMNIDWNIICLDCDNDRFPMFSETLLGALQSAALNSWLHVLAVLSMALQWSAPFISDHRYPISFVY